MKSLCVASGETIDHSARNAIKCTVTQIKQKPGVKPMAQNMLRQTAKQISDISIILTNKEEHSQRVAALKTDRMKQKRQIIVQKKQIDVLQHNLSEERALSFNGSNRTGSS
jgi:arginine/ornithine N-succinyltransferase beta subunit